MKKFRFSLETVLAYRRQEATRAQTELQQQEALRRKLQDQVVALSEQVLEARRDRLLAPSGNLLDGYLAGSRTQSRRLTQQVVAQGSVVEQKRQRWQEAQRQVRLLETLREKAQAEWRAQQAKEEEALTAELFIARWRPPELKEG